MTSIGMTTKLRLFLISTLVCIAYVNGAQDPKCLQPLDPGPCRMSLERYYYNAQINACQTFKFGGCQGNDNKFGFKQTCEDACLIKTAVKSAPASPKPAVAATPSSGASSSNTRAATSPSSPTTTTATTKQQTSPSVTKAQVPTGPTSSTATPNAATTTSQNSALNKKPIK